MVRRITEEFVPYIEELITNAYKIPNLSAIILFGSVVKGTADKSSDIDIMFLVDVPYDPTCKKEWDIIMSILNDIMRTKERKIQPIITTLKHADKDLLRAVAKEGVVIYGNAFTASADNLQLRPHILLTYDISHMPPAEKTKIYRIIYGYKMRKQVGVKEYKSVFDGVLRHGLKVSNATFIFPLDIGKEVETALQRAGAKTTSFEIWM